MPPSIQDIDPPRGREGDTVTIRGGGYSSEFGQTGVHFDGIPAGILSESEQELEVSVPPGISTDQLIAVWVQRKDTLDHSEEFWWWSKGSLSELQVQSIPGQVPGEQESITDSEPRVPEAKDYERLAQLAEAVREALQSRGEVLTSDGSSLVALQAGGAGSSLEAMAGETLGLRWTHSRRRLTLAWGKRVDSGAGNNGAMVAWGDTDQAATANGEHGSPLSGTVERAWVWVQEIGAPGTARLDRVRLDRNGITVHDSGAGLALGAGGLYQVPLTGIRVNVGDRLELVADKTTGGGLARLTGGVVLVEDVAVEIADTVQAEDGAEQEKTGVHPLNPAENISLGDALSVELS